MTIQDFKARYGRRAGGLRLIVRAYIGRAPHFRGDTELEAAIESVLADLGDALDNASPASTSSSCGEPTSHA